jgi:hypothetical protein
MTEIHELFSVETTAPQARETVAGGLVSWGVDNLYPQDLVAMYEDNPVHGGIVNQKVTFITSAGLEVETEFDDLIEGFSLDLELFNGFAIKWQRGDVGSKWRPFHVPMEHVRADGSGGWLVNADWSKKQKKVKVPCFTTISSEALVCLQVCSTPAKQSKQGNKLTLGFYPKPAYKGAITSILAGIAQDAFSLKEAESGYRGGVVVTLNNGVPATDAEADKIAEDIRTKSSSASSKGMAVLFSDGGENTPTITNLDGNNLNSRYDAAGAALTDKIMIAHQVGSPTLFGLNGKSMFGSKEEMETAFALFEGNYIKKRQRFIANGVEYGCLRMNSDSTTKIKFKRFDLTAILANIKPASVFRRNRMEQQPNRVFEALKVVGRKKIKALSSNTYDFATTDEQALSKFETFADLTKAQQVLIQLVQDGKTFDEIKQATNGTALSTAVALAKLRVKGVLKGWKADVKKSDLKFEVVYTYEVRSGLGAEVLPTTRDFCRDLIQLDRMYTRQEIDAISTATGEDVWRYRGGWYHNPNTGVNTPSCRHEWRQNIIKK